MDRERGILRRLLFLIRGNSTQRADYQERNRKLHRAVAKRTASAGAFNKRVERRRRRNAIATASRRRNRAA